MRITAKQAREKIQEIWPNLEYVWLADKAFWMPTVAVLDGLMQESRVKEMKFVDNLNDCDNFARQFHAEVQRKRYFLYLKRNMPPEQVVEAAIFKCAGIMHRGINSNHTWNIALSSDDGIQMIDMSPGEQRRWKADSDHDEIYFVTSF